MACCILSIFKYCKNKNRLCKNTNGSFCMQACASFSRLSGIILIFSVNPSVQRHMQTTHSLPGCFISQQIPSEKPGPHQMFGKGCCFETTVNFSLNRLHTGLDLTLLHLSSSRVWSVITARLPFLTSSVSLLQATNGNDPWSAWNADPSGGSTNNWASNPEGTQTGKSAPDPWPPVSHGHPQAYQGPGKKTKKKPRDSFRNHGCPIIRSIM